MTGVAGSGSSRGTGWHPAVLASGALLALLAAASLALAATATRRTEARRDTPPARHRAAARPNLQATPHPDVRSGPALAAAPAQRIFPEKVTDVDGSTIDVAKLAAGGRLVIVTLKATWCPVCQEQLVRLRTLLPRLRSCGATFLVLAPGPADELRQIARGTGFPYPFIEDRELAIARAVDLVLAPEQITPAIFILDEARQIAWLQRGRSGLSYGDGALLDELECPPLGTA